MPCRSITVPNRKDHLGNVPTFAAAGEGGPVEEFVRRGRSGVGSGSLAFGGRGGSHGEWRIEVRDPWR